MNTNSGIALLGEGIEIPKDLKLVSDTQLPDPLGLHMERITTVSLSQGGASMSGNVFEARAQQTPGALIGMCHANWFGMHRKEVPPNWQILRFFFPGTQWKEQRILAALTEENKNKPEYQGDTYILCVYWRGMRCVWELVVLEEARTTAHILCVR